MDYSSSYNDLPTSFFDGEDEENQNDRDREDADYPDER